MIGSKPAFLSFKALQVSFAAVLFETISICRGNGIKGTLVTKKLVVLPYGVKLVDPTSLMPSACTLTCVPASMKFGYSVNANMGIMQLY